MKSKPIRTKPGPVKPVEPPLRAKSATIKSDRVAAGKSGRSRSTGGSTPRSADSSLSSPIDLLRAGLNALSLPKADSVVADGLSRITDSFGLKKLEDVFDHRVAAAMERLGYPSAKALQRLVGQMTELAEFLNSQKTRR
jgi:hypothetical protein